jgi:hypothetical protein
MSTAGFSTPENPVVPDGVWAEPVQPGVSLATPVHDEGGVPTGVPTRDRVFLLNSALLI